MQFPVYTGYAETYLYVYAQDENSLPKKIVFFNTQ